MLVTAIDQKIAGEIDDLTPFTGQVQTLLRRIDEEATEAFKKVLGNYYMKDETPIAKALWRSFSHCQYVEDKGDIVFFKNKY
jgi:hypothetical protein